MTLSIGAVLGGPELENGYVEREIRRLMRLAKRVDEPSVRRASINVVFHVSGSISQVDFEGLRTAKFSRSEQKLMIQVAVPKDITDSGVGEFLISSLRQASSVAKLVFKKARIDFDENEYLGLVDKVGKQFVRDQGSGQTTAS